VIVDDNPADIELLRIALDEHGALYELSALRDGAEALRFVEERYTDVREPDPCVILLFSGESLGAIRRSCNSLRMFLNSARTGCPPVGNPS
jgi:hypothetical protein